MLIYAENLDKLRTIQPQQK